MSKTVTEYRPIGHDGRILTSYKFHTPDIDWGAYIHGKHKSEVAYWEKRTVTTSEWSRDK